MPFLNAANASFTNASYQRVTFAITDNCLKAHAFLLFLFCYFSKTEFCHIALNWLHCPGWH